MFCTDRQNVQARDACPYVSEMLQIINTDLDTLHKEYTVALHTAGP